MNTQQHQKLVYEIRSNNRAASKSEYLDRVKIVKGKHKGKYAHIVNKYCYSSNVYVKVENSDLEELNVHYTYIDFVDSNGDVIVVRPQDMTGREIEIGNFMVYSKSSGRNSHALEIGQVTAFTNVGAVKVKRVMRNGDKVQTGQYSYYNVETVINDPDKSLALPVSEEKLLQWVLMDFEGLGDI